MTRLRELAAATNTNSSFYSKDDERDYGVYQSSIYEDSSPRPVYIDSRET